MEGQFGPNTPQVTTFLSSLAGLTESEWNEALAIHRKPRSSLFATLANLLRWRLAWRAAAKAGRHEAKEAALQAMRSRGFRDSKEGEPSDRMTIVGTALFGLIVRDRLSARHFATLYQPFANVIPLGRLEGRE